MALGMRARWSSRRMVCPPVTRSLRTALTKEEVICTRRRATDSKDLYQVVELSVNVADDSHWRRDVDDVGFAHEHFLRLFADFSQQRLSKQLLVLEAFDASIEIEWRHWARTCTCGMVVR